VRAVTEEDCDSRRGLMVVQTTEKKKGLLRGLLGKLTKKDGKTAGKQAPPSTVKRQSTTALTAAAAAAAAATALSTERRDADPTHEHT